MAAYKAMTQEWLDAWKEKIATSAEYREIAKNWEGSVSIIMNPDPEKGIPEPVYIFMDFWHGDVLEIALCDKAKVESARFVMSGDYARWKQVARKEVDSTKALMQGKLKLKGDLTYVVRNIKTVNKVIDLLCGMETIWPDEA
ncbi:MAG: SCP2 sterol-binding domain-containing protein [Deltaproteobacteria bacterium]|nr:SCP2 sterol-binding domain-containing protein [Deltaproteobacteria bacterium]